MSVATDAIHALSAFLHDPAIEPELSPAERDLVHEVQGLLTEFED